MSPQHRRNVHFADHDSVVEIPHINDMSDEEVEGQYMSQTELQSIREQCKVYVRMIDEGLHMYKGKAKFCTRGLDQHIHAYTSQAQEIRDCIYDSVFSVQELQETADADLSELIAKVSQRLSIVSVQQACAIAEADARSVRVTRVAKSSSRRCQSARSVPKTKVSSTMRRKQMPIMDTLGPRLSSCMISLPENQNFEEIIDSALKLSYSP